jgi:hypothetical protein
MELMEYPQIKTIAIIAEGVPERVSPWPNVPVKFDMELTSRHAAG